MFICAQYYKAVYVKEKVLIILELVWSILYLLLFMLRSISNIDAFFVVDKYINAMVDKAKLFFL